MVESAADIYALDRSLQDSKWGEKVECIRSQLPATHAVVLLFTWNGVGHYEVVTYNKVISLPRTHDFVMYLDGLHGAYVTGLCNKERRRAGSKKGLLDEQVEDEVVD